MGFLIKVSGKQVEEIDVYLEIAAEFIIEGKIIGFPTDSVYGLGGDPLNLKSIEALYKIKFRDRNKGFLLLVADIEEASKVAEFDEISKKLALHYWPGELTLILKRKKSHNIIPMEVTAYQETIGLRVPNNPIILGILNKLKLKGFFGGIIGTSANYSGEPPSVSGVEVSQKFLGTGTIDYIIDGGKIKSAIPTTIVDCSKTELKFLRIGRLSEEEIINFLGERH